MRVHVPHVVAAICSGDTRTASPTARSMARRLTLAPDGTATYRFSNELVAQIAPNPEDEVTR